MDSEDRDLVTLSNGVVLRLGRPSVWLATEVQRQEAKNTPAVPQRFDEDKGRTVADPEHPNYLEAMAEHQARVIERLYDVGLTAVKVHSLPEGFPAAESDEWHGILAFAGVPLADTPLMRGLQWLKYVAVAAGPDFAAVFAPLMLRMGAPARTVDEVVAFAPSGLVAQATEPEPTPRPTNTNNDRQWAVR